MQQQLQAIVTILSLVNPLICAAMFAQIEAGNREGIHRHAEDLEHLSSHKGRGGKAARMMNTAMAE